MRLERLTTRQLACLRLLCAGKTAPEIAHALGIAVSSVASARSDIITRVWAPRGATIQDVCREAAKNDPTITLA